MTAMEETILRAPRARASRGAGVRRERPVAGRHERQVRQVRLVEAVEQPVRASRATRHAAQVGWVERARGLAGQARAWWAEGTGRVDARRGPTGGPAPTPAAAVALGRAAEPTPRHLAAVGRRATWGEDVVTGWCSVLLMLGLYLDGAGLAPLRWVLVLSLGVVLTIVNAYLSTKGGVLAGPDPWGGETLEWFATSPPPPHNFDVVPDVRSDEPLRDIREAVRRRDTSRAAPAETREPVA